MSLILNIDTSTETATVCLAENGSVVSAIKSGDQNGHAAFMHLAIRDLCKKNSCTLNELAAIAVISGPGSYTGLRVAMSGAKGLCYTLQTPFITMCTLDVMANATVRMIPEKTDTLLYCPLVDARRMEVFTGIYNSRLECLMPPASLILNENSFREFLNVNKVYFFGNGSQKLKAIIADKNAFFTELPDLTASMGMLSYQKFLAGNFTDLVDSEPLYLKEFYSPS